MEICSSNDDNNASIVEEEEAELRRLQQQLVVSTAEIDDAMQESRRKLDGLLGSSDRSSRHWGWDGSEGHGANQDELLSQFSPSELVYNVLTRTHALATDDAPRSSHTQLQQQLDSESSAWSLESALPRHPSSPRVQHSCSSELLPPRREAQSALYRKWQDDRVLKITQLASTRDQQTLRQAQHSMQRFQQTLAAIQSGQR